MVQVKWHVAVHGRDLYLLKPTLGPPEKFKHLTRAEVVAITRLWIGHTRANKSHILSRGPPTACQNCGQTLTIDHMLLGCAVLQGSRDEYYTVNSLNTLFETIPEICIVECNPLHMKTQKVRGMGDIRPPIFKLGKMVVWTGSRSCAFVITQMDSG